MDKIFIRIFQNFSKKEFDAELLLETKRFLLIKNLHYTKRFYLKVLRKKNINFYELPF